jgi:hypothetical protein
MRICSNCFGVIYLNDWECGCGRQNKGMGVDQQLLKPLDVEQKLKADGWRRCSEGQGETQFCALLEAAVLAEKAKYQELQDVIDSIYTYANDTLSGRIDGPDDREWQHAAVVEIRNRARVFATSPSAIRARGNT